MMKKEFLSLVKDIYGTDFVPLHRPVFEGKEKQYLMECIDSNFVSSVGEKVTEFEELTAKFTDSKFAIATVNGTSALHMCLHLAGVERFDEVITQALTFVATCNAITYCGASPVFIDVDKDTMGMSPSSLESFLDEFVEIRGDYAYNKNSGKRIKACVPMHTFGFPCRIEEISSICSQWNLELVEDAAESLGSFYCAKHTGTLGSLGAISYNGNKIITTGGGGMIITNDESLAIRAKHITTTAKVPHAYEFVHDEIGFNYRMPNLNAALGCAQMETLPKMLEIKESIIARYGQFFDGSRIKMIRPIEGATCNNWLSAIILNSRKDRDGFLSYTNENGVMTRPIWRLMSDLEMFQDCQKDGLENSRWLEERVVNIPSSVPSIN
ncbi:LegC family aminotransferase [Opitutales bacterium]|nr:LegC family aminotransferase [Opitutales bacterium]